MKFRFKLVKFSNFETFSPIFATPSSPIELTLINFKIQYLIFILLLQDLLIIYNENLPKI